MTPDAAFEACRPRLLAVAYGMLGDRGEAEDVVQDAWLRWHGVDPATLREPEAFLVTVTSRLALDRLASARVRRERYVGPWLPEPLVADGSSTDPLVLAVEAEQLTLALLTALERLGPVERAVLLLHDVFDVPFEQVAAVVERSPAACRQAAKRARDRLDAPTRRQHPSQEDQQRVVAAFSAAVAHGDLDALVAVLRADAVVTSDGGGVVRAARKPILGAAKSARFLLALRRKLDPAVTAQPVRVNGDPGVRLLHPAGVVGVLALEVTGDDRVAAVRIVVNPEKLTRV